MSETFEIIRYVLATLFVGSGSWFVIQWRVGQLESSRTDDKKQAENIRLNDRDELRKLTEGVWSTIHDIEKKIHQSEIETYEERLKTSDKFTTVLLAQGNLSGEVKNIALGIARLEVDLRGLVQEIKK